MTDIDTLRRAVEEGKLVRGSVLPGQSVISVDDLEIIDLSDPVRDRRVRGTILLCWEFRFNTGWAWTCYDLTYVGPQGEDTEIFLFAGSLDDPQHALDQCLQETARLDQRLREWRCEEGEFGQLFVQIPSLRADPVSLFFSDPSRRNELLVTGTTEEVIAAVGTNLAKRLQWERQWRST